jgi:NitT/TauT family transport system substrate-binding protein
MSNRLVRMMALAAITLCAPIAAPGAARAETITVTHWGSAFYGAPYAVALEKGFFKSRGLDITGFLTSAGGGTSVRNTLAGDLPFGEVALPAALLAIKSGQPLKIIGGGVESIADIAWITQLDSPMNSLADVVGRKVAFTSPGSVTNMVLLMCLNKAGIDPKSVKLLAAGDIGANLSAVLNRAIDAGMTSEPLWSEYQTKVKAAFWAKDCTNPAMTQTVTVTTAEFAKTGGAKLRALLDARREGVEYILAHPEEAADITARAFNGDKVLYRQVFKHFLEIGYFGDGRLQEENLNRMADGMRLVGQLAAPVEWTAIVDRSFLPERLQAAR